ncbi:ABC transporter permease [Mesomycoplasma conjunctivae]|uniref:ABC transporter permease n=1 Tax=Mesomycoplasma conjunctivae TaxID=45361 RepID=UPI003DA35E78
MVIIPIITYFIVFFCVLLIGAFAGFFSEKSGTVNIAIDGMMIIGATFYGLLGQQIQNPSMWMQLFLLPFSATLTALFAVLHGFITIKLKGNHIISGVAMNLLAVAISVIFIKIFGVNQQKFNSPVNELTVGADIQNDWTNIISFKLFLTLAMIVVIYIIFKKSRWGLHFAAVGENPHAAAAAGINVNKIKWIGVLISGFIAGLAGGIYFQYATSTFVGNVGGLGFLSLIILIMGRWKTLPIVGAALLFSFLYSLSINIGTGTGVFEALRDYSNIIYISPYLITLIVLAISSKRDFAPKFLGIPYDKSLK